MTTLGRPGRTAAALGLVVILAMTGGCSHQRSSIDFLDFVHVAGKDYYNTALPTGSCTKSGGPDLTATDLGPVAATTRVDLEKTGRASHRLADGDAGRLPVGTKLYEVTGFSASFRLAARIDGRLTLYELADNPAARRGSDLLDLTGTKVESIAVSAASDNPATPVTALGAIDDPAQVAHLVEMAMAAPVDNQAPRAANDKQYCLTFRLQHGPWISRPYFPTSGAFGLGQRLDLPPAFRAAVDAATG